MIRWQIVGQCLAKRKTIRRGLSIEMHRKRCACIFSIFNDAILLNIIHLSHFALLQLLRAECTESVSRLNFVASRRQLLVPMQISPEINPASSPFYEGLILRLFADTR